MLLLEPWSYMGEEDIVVQLEAQAYGVAELRDASPGRCSCPLRQMWGSCNELARSCMQKWELQQQGCHICCLGLQQCSWSSSTMRLCIVPLRHHRLREHDGLQALPCRPAHMGASRHGQAQGEAA